MAYRYRYCSRDFLIGATVGSLLGTVTTLMLAPKSGKKLRQDICDAYCDITDRTQDVASKFGRRGKSFVKGLSSQTSDWTDKAKDIIEDMSEGISGWMHPDRRDGETPRGLLIGGLIGGILGAITGILLAPKSGVDLRQDIAETYEDFTEKAQEFAGQVGRKGKAAAGAVQSQAEDWLDVIRDIADRLMGEGKETGERLKETAMEKGKGISSRMNDIIDWASLGYRLWKGFAGRR